MKSDADDMSDYLLDNYGVCDLGADCYWRPGCLKTGWRGRACQFWKPLGATTWAELEGLLQTSDTRVDLSVVAGRVPQS